MNIARMLKCPCEVFLLLCLSLSLLSMPTTSFAAPDCNPRSIVGRAVGGAILNQGLGSFNRLAGALAGVENGISPTPSSAMRDCILPALNPPPRDEPPFDPTPIGSAPPRAPAIGWGDPHLVTHDGAGYDFQAAGDYVYVEGGGLSVQGRQFRLSPAATVSRIKAIAVRVGETSVVINDPIDRSLINFESGIEDVINVNGIDLPIGLGGWIDLDAEGSFVQRFKSSTYLKIVGKVDLLISHDGNTFQLVLDESLQGKVSGLLGDFDGDPANDLKTAAGRLFTVDDTATLYGEYLTDWLRQGDASLFNSEFNPLVDGAYSVDALPSLSDTALATREALAQRCISAGAQQGFLLRGCIYDLLFDGDEQLLENMAPLQSWSNTVIAASAFSSSTAPPIALAINASVSPMQPAPGAGQLSARREVDRFTATVPAGSQQVLQWVSPCSVAQPFSLLLQHEDGRAVEHGTSCDAAISLPQGQLSLSVYSQSGDTGDYFFNLLEPANTDLGIIALNEPVSGMLTNTERLIATLPSVPGNKIYIASNQQLGCSREWQLLDAANTVLVRNSVCNDLGLVLLSMSSTYRIRVLQDVASGYAFTVLTVGEASTIIPDNDREFELTIASLGQSASAAFAVTQGDRIYVNRSGGVASGKLIVTDPQLIQIAATAAFEEDIQFEASSSGTFTLTLQPNDFIGTVQIQLVSVADDTQVNVSRGDIFTLALSTLGQRATATFDALEGETFTLTVRTTDTVSGLSIGPNIQPPEDANALAVFGSRTFTAESSGTYQIVLDSDEQDDFIGSVVLELQ